MFCGIIVVVVCSLVRVMLCMFMLFRSIWFDWGLCWCVMSLSSVFLFVFDVLSRVMCCFVGMCRVILCRMG